jgi:hypothetical protein
MTTDTDETKPKPRWWQQKYHYASALEKKLDNQKKVIIKTYKGSQATAMAAFQADAARMAKSDYFPTSQSWAPGTYGCGAFLVALLLCVLLVGILIFIYMLIVTPDGTLTVTYEFRAVPDRPAKAVLVEEKTCPKCAEQVKGAALICRFCGHQFAPTSS